MTMVLVMHKDDRNGNVGVDYDEDKDAAADDDHHGDSDS
jgi:hypothetical protein